MIGIGSKGSNGRCNFTSTPLIFVTDTDCIAAEHIHCTGDTSIRRVIGSMPSVNVW